MWAKIYNKLSRMRAEVRTDEIKPEQTLKELIICGTDFSGTCVQGRRLISVFGSCLPRAEFFLLVSFPSQEIPDLDVMP
jgi:hypothetical protein